MKTHERPPKVKINFVKRLGLHRGFINVPLYKAYVAVAYSTDRKALTKYLRRFKIPQSYEVAPDVAAVAWDNLEDGACVIGITELPKSSDQIACLSHECLHVALYILRSRHQGHNEYSDESLCYLHEYLLGESLKAFKSVR